MSAFFMQKNFTRKIRDFLSVLMWYNSNVERYIVFHDNSSLKARRPFFTERLFWAARFSCKRGDHGDKYVYTDDNGVEHIVFVRVID